MNPNTTERRRGRKLGITATLRPTHVTGDNPFEALFKHR